MEKQRNKSRLFIVLFQWNFKMLESFFSFIEGNVETFGPGLVPISSLNIVLH
jgi:hypothetical protein